MSVIVGLHGCGQQRGRGREKEGAGQVERLSFSSLCDVLFIPVAVACLLSPLCVYFRSVCLSGGCDCGHFHWPNRAMCLQYGLLLAQTELSPRATL